VNRSKFTEREAFVAASSIRSDMDERAPELFYQIGQNLGRVLCISRSACNDQTVYMLSKAGAKVTYIIGSEPVSD
jgi:hypothetical protein